MAGIIFKHIKKKIDAKEDEDYFVVTYEFVADTFDEALELKKQIETDFNQNKDE